MESNTPIFDALCASLGDPLPVTENQNGEPHPVPDPLVADGQQ